MQPASISPTGVQVYETCSARFKATHIDRVPDMSGTAADLGTTCHEALEMFVKNDHHLDPNLTALLGYYETAYWKYFTDKSRHTEGRELLENWFQRTDLRDGRKVLTTEIKSTFNVKFSGGELPVNYVFDRCDELPDGSIEVVDYKSWVRPIQPTDLKQKIQARCYALAAAIAYPGRKLYWVTFDQLRYDPVGIVFTRDENIETYRYLQNVAERIWADDGTTERLNPECRWCVRKAACKTLLDHAAGGGILGIDTIDAAIDQRAKLDYASNALNVMIKNLDEFIINQAQEGNWLEYATEETALKISAKARRTIDPERAARIIGPELMARYGKLNITAIDQLLKGSDLDAASKSALRALISRELGAPSVNTSPRNFFSEED